MRKPKRPKLIVFQKDERSGVCRLRIFWLVWIWGTKPPVWHTPVASDSTAGAEALYMREHPEIWPVRKVRRGRRK